MSGFFSSFTKKAVAAPPPSPAPTPPTPSPAVDTTERRERRPRVVRDASPPLPDVDEIVTALEEIYDEGGRYTSAAARVLRLTDSQRRRQRERGTPDLSPDSSLIAVVRLAIKRLNERR